MREAIENMNAPDSVARKVLGDEFVDHFVATRVHELRLWETTVTNWELKRYMETV
jgi:glutamine synthetase